jgi:hypothetical protein
MSLTLALRPFAARRAKIGQSPDGNAEQPGQLLDRESLLLGAQLLNESHLDECLQESGKRRAGKAAMANLAALLFTNLSPLCGPVQ